MEQFSCFDFDLSENVRFDNHDFPSSIKKINLSIFPDYITMNQWHNEMEFIYVISGSMTVVIDGENVDLAEDMGLFINSHRMKYAFNAEKKDCTYIRLLLSPELLSANPMFEQKYVKPFTSITGCPYQVLTAGISWQEEMLNIIKRIYESKDDGWTYFAIQILYMRMFELLYFNTVSNPTPQASDMTNIYTLKLVLLYIHDHYLEKLSLEQISDAGGCGKSKCSELFKQYLNISPVNYLPKYRMAKSLVLLLETKKSISQIGAETGFAGSSYFCETFKKTYGISAAEYRRMHVVPEKDNKAQAARAFESESNVNLQDMYDEEAEGSAEAGQANR